MAVTNSGTSYAVDISNGGMSIQNILSGRTADIMENPPTNGVKSEAGDFVDATPKVNYLWYILGIFILLVLFKIASEHSKSGMQLELMGIGVWNFLAVGIMASLFIMLAKTLLNKYQVKGLTDLYNAV